MSARKRRCLPLQIKEIRWLWTCHCPLRGTIPGRASGEETSKLAEGAVAVPGKPIRPQRKATVGEEGLLLPENQSQRGEDVVEVLSSVAAAEEVVAEVDIWTETRKDPMLTSWKRRRWARTQPSRRLRP
jgi:hypothetical protein